ncbi:MAG: hypothetical protein Q8J78_17375 [Moraxellaceae bacterium]|nr:hypothetical protein [Moraxellaceae bacterium]
MHKISSLATTALHHNRDALLNALRALHVTSAIIDYEGMGDSGDISTVAVTPSDCEHQLQTEKIAWQVVTRQCNDGAWESDISTRSLSVMQALHEFTLQWLELIHGGWENNDGARGTLTINAPDNQFQLEHESFYTESCHHAYEM